MKYFEQLFEQLKTPRKATALVGVLFAITLLLAGSAASAQQRVKPINGKNGVKSVVEGRAKGKDHATSFAHVTGHAEYSHSRGLTVDGIPVTFTSRTAVYPNINGASSDVQPRQFSGRELTIFGEVGPGSIEAVFVILSPTVADSPVADTTTDPDVVPSPSDPRVGIVRESAPE